MILLTGGTKQRQQKDVDAAKAQIGRITNRGATERTMTEADMALTKSVKGLVQRRVASDATLAENLLREGIDTMLSGDIDAGKAILRDYIKATVGFEKLAMATGTPAKSLIRMFGPRGNPLARNLFGVICYLQKQAGIELQVTPGSR